MIDRAFVIVPAQAAVANFMGTFAEYPLRQKAASFEIDQIMEKLSSNLGSH
ncbi:MAG: hypothetical protein ABGZ37_04015 [Akkermansiaceae bacterium]